MPDTPTMPELPEHLFMRETRHGTGDSGLAFYDYEDNAGLGVQMQARRERRGERFVETWFHQMLPGMTFTTYAAMCEAYAKLTPEDIAAEKAMYPYIRELKKDSCGNACRLCPRPPYMPGSRVLHDTWRVDVATGWRASDGHFASLCHVHKAQFGHDPAALLAALDAEVVARRARADARKALLPSPPAQEDKL